MKIHQIVNTMNLLEILGFETVRDLEHLHISAEGREYRVGSNFFKEWRYVQFDTKQDLQYLIYNKFNKYSKDTCLLEIDISL